MKYWRHWAKLLAALVVIAGSITLATATVGPDSIHRALLRADGGWVGLLVGGQLLAYLGYALTYKALFNLPWFVAAKHTFYGFSPLAALGGFVYDAKTIGPEGRHKIAALSALEMLVLAPGVLGAAIFALADNLNISPGLTVPWVAGVPAGLAVATVIIVCRHKMPIRLAGAIDKLLAEFRCLGSRQWAAIIVGITVYWACEIAVLAGALQLFNAHLDTDALIIAYATGYILTRRSVPAGLAGFAIIFMMLALHWVGVPYAAAFLAVYSYLTVNIALPMCYLAAHRRVIV